MYLLTSPPRAALDHYVPFKSLFFCRFDAVAILGLIVTTSAGAALVVAIIADKLPNLVTAVLRGARRLLNATCWGRLKAYRWGTSIFFVEATVQPGRSVSFLRWACILAALLVVLVANDSHAQARVSESDKETYHRMVDFCRGSVPRPMTLTAGGWLVCFDGWIDVRMDLSSVRALKDYGLFVVRSFGGDDESAIALSNLLRDRHATVVVYGYCIAACAMYLFIAADQTYVIDGAFVVWRGPPNMSADCASFYEPRDKGPKKLRRVPCSNASAWEQATYSHLELMMNEFYSQRTVDDSYEIPPDSVHTRRALKNLYDQIGVYVDVGWTLNPRYHRMFKTKIFYEAYPNSQAEVDMMTAKFNHVEWLNRVIYDP